MILVNVNPAYRTHELAVRAAAVGLPDAGRGAGVQDQRLRRDGRRGPRRRCGALERVVFFDTPSWDELLAGAEARRRGRRCASARRRWTPATRSTSSTRAARRASPRARRSATATSSTTASSSARAAGITERTASASPCPTTTASAWCMGNLAATTHGACVVLPAEAFEPGAVLEAVQAESCTALYGVPTMFIAELDHPDFDRFDLTSLRTGIMAGSPCPVEVMRQVIDRMHMEEVTICYGMTETSPVSTQTGADDDLEHRTGDRRPRPPARRDPGRRPGDRARTLAARRDGRVPDPRLQRDARLLGRPGAHRRGDRRRRLDAHRRPGDRWTTTAT